MKVWPKSSTPATAASSASEGAVAPRPRKPASFMRDKLILLACSLGFSILLGEATLRLFFHERFKPADDERNLLYEYHEVLGWFPQKNCTRLFTATRTVTVTHNGDGFRGPERVENGKPNVLFLGDSFVWGFDVEADERFTEKLQKKHPEWNVYNLGVSGYGTDQELLLLASCFEKYKPSAVILIFCADNDDTDNTVNFSNGGYYKPFFTVQGKEGIRLNGVPVPRSERAILAGHRLLGRSYLVRLFVRAWCKGRTPVEVHTVENATGLIIHAMRDHTVQRGAYFAVGLEKAKPNLQEYLEHFHIPFVDLSVTNRYPEHGGHWTPEGHSIVCDRIDALLTKAGLANRAEF
jgi:hypothetical protein